MKFKKSRSICEVELACKSCLDLACQKNSHSTDKHFLKRQPPNEKHQKLPWYNGEWKQKDQLLISRLRKQF